MHCIDCGVLYRSHHTQHWVIYIHTHIFKQQQANKIKKKMHLVNLCEPRSLSALLLLLLRLRLRRRGKQKQRQKLLMRSLSLFLGILFVAQTQFINIGVVYEQMKNILDTHQIFYYNYSIRSVDAPI